MQNVINHIDTRRKQLYRVLSNGSKDLNGITCYAEIVSIIHPVVEPKQTCGVCDVDIIPTDMELLKFVRNKMDLIDDGRLLFDIDLIHGVQIVDCQDAFCLSCFREYIVSKLEDDPLLIVGKVNNSPRGSITQNKYTITCPLYQPIHHECQCNITSALAIPFLTNAQFDLYNNRAMGLSTSVEGIVVCPNRGGNGRTTTTTTTTTTTACGFEFFREGIVPKHCLCLCPRCEVLICLHCLVTLNNDSTSCYSCDNNNNDDDDHNNITTTTPTTTLQQSFQQFSISNQSSPVSSPPPPPPPPKLRTEADIKSETIVQQHQKCPSCKAPIYRPKDQGCDHIKCALCGQDFCYLCGDTNHKNGNHVNCLVNNFAHLDNL
jgi:hypothetical protein